LPNQLANQTGLAYAFGVIAKLKTIAALGLMLSAFGGCASGHLNSSSSNPFQLTVELGTPETMQKIEIAVYLGVPFAVSTQDTAGNHYQVSGTLRQKTQESFQLNPGKIEVQYASGGRCK
jgi:hypothetical protein